jgi:mannose-1-phosphate guanylyltransferase
MMRREAGHPSARLLERDRPPGRVGGGASLPAVVLVGGEGTRLRPLTEKTPKPMLPLLGRPLLSYTFDHLRSAGSNRVVLACGYLPTLIEDYFGTRYDGLSLEYRVEPETLGTGGAIRFGAEGLRETFLALNGDCLRDADIGALVDFHRAMGAKATILLARVSDPGRYGLVRRDEVGRVTAFVEKPEAAEIDTNLINAGLYVLEPEVLDLITPGVAVSIEREVFPALVAEGSLYALALPGYWLDVGTPQSYLQAHFDLLNRNGGVEIAPTAEIGTDASLVPPLYIGSGVKVQRDARIGPCVALGADSQVGRRGTVRFSTVLAAAKIAARARITHGIVAPEIGVITP